MKSGLYRTNGVIVVISQTRSVDSVIMKDELFTVLDERSSYTHLRSLRRCLYRGSFYLIIEGAWDELIELVI